MSNAFQNTRTDDDLSLPKLFCRCAPGFEQYDADGDQLCCQLNVGMQGRIDACRIFTKRFERTVADNADMQRCLWDPKVYVYHEGALAGTAASLDDVIREAQSDAPVATTICGYVQHGAVCREVRFEGDALTGIMGMSHEGEQHGQRRQ